MSFFNANLFYSNKIHMIYSEHYWDENFIKSLDSTVYLFHQFAWNCESIIDSFPWNLHEKFNALNPNFNFKSNIIFCSPNSLVHNKIIEKGYNSVLLNHNALVDYNKFYISDDKKFKAILIARPFWWKRVFLANQVDGLAYVKGFDWAKDATSWDGWKNMNFSHLAEEVTPPIVADLISKSSCGLILSGNTGLHVQNLNEGANYSTIEYLFSGIPVISTPNLGGRNFWLNEYNSVTVNPEPTEISNTVNKINLNELLQINSSYQIRNSAILMTHDLRNNFIQKIGEIFYLNNVNSNPYEVFSDVYFHKFLNYKVLPVDLIQQIKS
jgi:glycosyltransferase involved in cell wall biosynthesis